MGFNIMKKHPDIKGFKLLIEYPGCRRKVGDFESYTSGLFLKYPKIWEPIYYRSYIRNKKLQEILHD